MEILDYTWYQEAAYSTCTRKCYKNNYLIPGHISEIGEFAGKIAKKIRGDNVQDTDIMGELGDCAWFIAVRSRLRDIPLKFNKEAATKFTHKTAFEEFLLWAVLNRHPLQTQWFLLKYTCEALGFSFDEILKMNNKKLESRQKRKVIQGNGDYR